MLSAPCEVQVRNACGGRFDQTRLVLVHGRFLRRASWRLILPGNGPVIQVASAGGDGPLVSGLHRDASHPTRSAGAGPFAASRADQLPCAGIRRVRRTPTLMVRQAAVDAGVLEHCLSKQSASSRAGESCGGRVVPIASLNRVCWIAPNSTGDRARHSSVP